ncbi:MAG TPA: amidohydrolase family protein [Streptosporangiaceae bacterium]|nr:amidohydrolase family protein [Streptosporangiaceae bacterium]
MTGVVTVQVPGFVDHHTHLLKDSAAVGWPWQGGSVREFHQQVLRDKSTPMDVAEPGSPAPLDELAARLRRGLAKAAGAGLVEITEMGMRQWWYLDALARLARRGSLPVRVRVYLASGLAEQASLADLDARRADASPWVRLEGVKFYADGWLVPRTCALCRDFADEDQAGLLFQDAPALARRIEPFAARGWRIATHAIGDRGIQTVLDAYELAWGNDARAISAAMPRIEHGSIQSAETAARIAALGVSVCIQPSFALSDARHVRAALGQDRLTMAYPWTMLAAAGVRPLLGTDYPIEVIQPLVGLARLVKGRSDRAGFGTDDTAPEQSRLSRDLAFSLMSDESAGTTLLSADPRVVPDDDLDQIEVHGTDPAPF